MILLIIILVLALGTPTVFFVLTKKGIFKRKFAFVSALYVSCLAIFFSSFSAIYHNVGNEAAYQTCLAKRKTLLDKNEELKTKVGQATYEKEHAALVRDVENYNYELKLDKENANNPWISVFAYRYALEHFDELIITL